MKKVYFVDDEYWLLTELKSIINWQEQGFEICGFTTDPFQAEIEILEKEPDLVICDIYMDCMDGFELAEKILQKKPSIVFCFLSAYNKFEYAVTALKLGAVDYLTKPLKVNDLIAVLNKVAKKEKEGTYGSFWELATQRLQIDENSLKDVLKDKLIDTPKDGEARFIVISGKSSGEAVDDIETSQTKLLFDGAEIKVFISRDFSIEQLKNLSKIRKYSVSVSQPLTNDNFAVALAVAISNSTDFITNSEEKIVVYKQSSKINEFLQKLGDCQNKYEVRVLVKTLKDFIYKNRLCVYDVINLTNQIKAQSLKFGVVLSDEISDKLPVIYQFESVELLCEKLNEIFDKVCNKTANSIINSIVKDIQLNYAQVQSLEVYAKKYGYNTSYLSWLFKKEIKSHL